MCGQLVLLTPLKSHAAVRMKIVLNLSPAEDILFSLIAPLDVNERAKSGAARAREQRSHFLKNYIQSESREHSSASI